MSKAYHKKCRTIVKLCFDVPTCLSFVSNLVGPKTGGVCGTVASALSIYEIFGS